MKYCVDKNWMKFNLIKNPPTEIQSYAVKANWRNIRRIECPNRDMQLDMITGYMNDKGTDVFHSQQERIRDLGNSITKKLTHSDAIKLMEFYAL